MKITVEGPCVVEADGPITVWPIATQTEVLLDLLEEPAAIEATPKRTYVRRANGAPAPAPYVYPTRRKPMPRKNKVCINCHRTYRGTTQQMYCSNKCKHAYYDRGNKGEPQGLDIKAGASGVDVEVVNR